MRFVDLFAGAGMLRLAFERAGHTCVGGCEIDRWARRTYAVNFDEFPEGKDIRDYTPSQPFDILCGGFPCQTFSQLGKRAGFDDVRGVLYQQVIRLLRDYRPTWYFLENVPGLVTMKDCFAAIQDDLESLGYSFAWKVIDSALVWTQSRKRVYMVGNCNSLQWDFPEIRQRTYDIRELLDYRGKMVSPRVWRWLRRRRAQGHTGAWGYRMIDKVSPTITASHSDRILLPGKPRPRWLSMRERARLMGLPDSFQFPVSEQQANRQIGNGVVVPLVEILAEGIK